MFHLKIGKKNLNDLSLNVRIDLKSFLTFNVKNRCLKKGSIALKRTRNYAIHI